MDMSYKIILFDLDGTLTDPKEGITRSVQFALDSLGILEPDLDRLVCFIGPPLLDSFRDFFGLNPEQAKQGLLKYRERFQAKGIFENALLPGVPEMLRALKEAGKVIALATSKPEPFALQILEHFEILPYFDAVVGSGLDESRGSKAEVINEAFLRLEIKEEQKREIVMVGDRKHDVIGAKLCGIHSLGVAFGYAPAGELEESGAEHLVQTVEELAQFLLQN